MLGIYTKWLLFVNVITMQLYDVLYIIPKWNYLNPTRFGNILFYLFTLRKKIIIQPLHEHKTIFHEYIFFSLLLEKIKLQRIADILMFILIAEAFFRKIIYLRKSITNCQNQGSNFTYKRLRPLSIWMIEGQPAKWNRVQIPCFVNLFDIINFRRCTREKKQKSIIINKQTRKN